MTKTDNPLASKALALVWIGIGAADPSLAVNAAMPSVIADPPRSGGSWRIIAVGKAARAMAMTAMKQLPDAQTLIVTNAGNDAPLMRAEVLRAGHPVPDEDGAQAARRVAERLAESRPADRILALISGGGSAMLPAPVEGVTLTEKQEVNRLLLASGADIRETNLIRQALSRLKGGGWLRQGPAPITALILSDVPGDDLRVVASGPTVAPIGTIAEAARTARALEIWDRLPDAVRAALSRSDDRGDLPEARNILVGSNRHSVQAMVAAGGCDGAVPLEGDVEDCARVLVAAARQARPGVPLVFGGETTVRLTGKGMGGRNQELALRFARAAAEGGLKGDWCFASVGSDGRDGPGEAAGGIVDPGTLTRIEAAGIDLDRVLADNDSTPALAAAGGLVQTGPTGTNVADLAVFLRGAEF